MNKFQKINTSVFVLTIEKTKFGVLRTLSILCWSSVILGSLKSENKQKF